MHRWFTGQTMLPNFIKYCTLIIKHRGIPILTLSFVNEWYRITKFVLCHLPNTNHYIRYLKKKIISANFLWSNISVLRLWNSLQNSINQVLSPPLNHIKAVYVTLSISQCVLYTFPLLRLKEEIKKSLKPHFSS